MNENHPSMNAERYLIERIRQGDSDTWQLLIDRYEGRLMAFVSARLIDSSHAEDIVQDTFIGFLNSLPNFDCERPLESYLFSIATYKLTDHLRKQGRRPTTSLSFSDSETDATQLVPAPFRAVSSLARSIERRDEEELALVNALQEQIGKWISKEDWRKLKCIELLFVVGMSNKEIAEQLSITEQQVANYKSDFVQRTKSLLTRFSRSDSFPELT